VGIRDGKIVGANSSAQVRAQFFMPNECRRTAATSRLPLLSKALDLTPPLSREAAVLSSTRASYKARRLTIINAAIAALKNEVSDHVRVDVSLVADAGAGAAHRRRRTAPSGAWEAPESLIVVETSDLSSIEVDKRVRPWDDSTFFLSIAGAPKQGCQAKAH
jgi:hypothetical protein